MLATLVVATVAMTTTIASTVAAVPSAHASVTSRRLPPADFKTLARVFDPALRKLGLRTSRAMLQNIKTYARDPHGSHLAVYVQPINASYTDAEYVTHFVPVAQVFLHSIFKRWKDLRSFDVCQEPRPGEDPRREPPPVTQLYVTRAGATGVRWQHATIADLVEATAHNKPPTKTDGGINDVFAYFTARLNSQPTLVRAQAAAGATTTTSTTP
jgi:hypothetical protein